MVATRSTDYGAAGQRMRRWRKRYKRTDISKRHRLPDRQPKEERVVSYVRRKA